MYGCKDTIILTHNKKLTAKILLDYYKTTQMNCSFHTLYTLASQILATATPPKPLFVKKAQRFLTLRGRDI